MDQREYSYRRWAWCEFAALVVVFIAALVLVPFVLAMYPAYLSLLFLSALVTIPFGCFLASQFEAWALAHPARGRNVHAGMTELEQGRLYYFAETLTLAPLCLLALASLFVCGAADQVQPWNIALTVVAFLSPLVAYRFLVNAFMQDARMAEDDEA